MPVSLLHRVTNVIVVDAEAAELMRKDPKEFERKARKFGRL
jgi:hypothetical protein